MIDHTPAWTLPQLEAYLEATLRRMGINRDVRADQQGEPVFDVVRTGRKADGSLRIDLTVDLSGIGMPVKAPLAVIDGQGGQLTWFLGDILIASTPKSDGPEQSGDALGMDQLLAAHRAWVRRNAETRSR
jgi:hypothetical protein